jgi:hypothetical protein
MLLRQQQVDVECFMKEMEASVRTKFHDLEIN